MHVVHAAGGRPGSSRPPFLSTLGYSISGVVGLVVATRKLAPDRQTTAAGNNDCHAVVVLAGLTGVSKGPFCRGRQTVTCAGTSTFILVKACRRRVRTADARVQRAHGSRQVIQ